MVCCVWREKQSGSYGLRSFVGGLEGIFLWLLNVMDSILTVLNRIFKLLQDSFFPRQCLLACSLLLGVGCLALKHKS